MKNALALACMLACSTPAVAGDWGTTDKVMLGTALTALTLDWAQTRQLAREVEGCYHVTGCHEVNPLLGPRPGMGKVNAYFVAAIAGTVALSFALPQHSRRQFLGAITVVETAVVINNHHVGLSMRF